MSDTECPRCGSPMRAGGVCPVCEIAHDADDRPATREPAHELPADSLVGRIVQSGRFALALAVVFFAAGSALPLLFVQRGDHLGPRVGKSVVQMVTAEEPYGRALKSTVVIAVPAAALVLLSLLWSRRTRTAMLASRPLILVLSLLPIAGAALPILKLSKHRHSDAAEAELPAVERFEHSTGPGLGFVVLGSIAGFVGALQFGRGTSDPPRRRRDEDDGD